MSSKRPTTREDLERFRKSVTDFAMNIFPGAKQGATKTTKASQPQAKPKTGYTVSNDERRRLEQRAAAEANRKYNNPEYMAKMGDEARQKDIEKRRKQAFEQAFGKKGK